MWIARFSYIAILYCLDLVYDYSVQGFSYPFLYLCAGIAGALSVILFGYLGTNQLVKDIRIIQTLFVAIHAYGFAIYQFDLPPDSYDNTQTVLLTFQTLWILWARHDIRDHRANNNGLDGFRKPNNNMHTFNFEGSHK